MQIRIIYRSFFDGKVPKYYNIEWSINNKEKLYIQKEIKDEK